MFKVNCVFVHSLIELFINLTSPIEYRHAVDTRNIGKNEFPFPATVHVMRKLNQDGRNRFLLYAVDSPMIASDFH